MATSLFLSFYSYIFQIISDGEENTTPISSPKTTERGLQSYHSWLQDFEIFEITELMKTEANFLGSGMQLPNWFVPPPYHHRIKDYTKKLEQDEEFIQVR